MNFRWPRGFGGRREFYFTELHCDDPYRVRPHSSSSLPRGSFIIMLLYILYYYTRFIIILLKPRT